jgi:phage/plasmid-associated DNA primase
MVHIGLSLMGDRKMHYAGAIIGPPRVGKSTALNLANLTCGISEGEYAGKTLFNPDLEGKRTRYMQNKKRIVCIDELPVAALRNEETVKNMMAHSGVEMRGMMRDEELDNRWKPKIFMAMNEKPEYKDTSGAIKERIVPLMVSETRPKDQRDLNLIDKTKMELGGFASSCIRLAQAALKRGYYPLSGAMKAVINEMEAANNPLKSFIQEKCILDTEGFVFISVLHTQYSAYCEDARNIPLAKAKMSNELTQMGKGIIQKKKRNPDNGYLSLIRRSSRRKLTCEMNALEDGLNAYPALP